IPLLHEFQLAPPSALLKTPAPVPAYNVVGVCGSMANAVTVLPYGPWLVHCAMATCAPFRMMINHPINIVGLRRLHPIFSRKFTLILILSILWNMRLRRWYQIPFAEETNPSLAGLRRFNFPLES